MLNRQKLIKLFVDKQDELGMTQDQLAKWFSDLGGNTVSHGFIQTMTSPKKTSTPEWDNMKTIAKMWNVTLDELNYYFENDEIKDVKEAKLTNKP
jgi:aspartate/tyrosine/aromatic aminotransferase